MVLFLNRRLSLRSFQNLDERKRERGVFEERDGMLLTADTTLHVLLGNFCCPSVLDFLFSFQSVGLIVCLGWVNISLPLLGRGSCVLSPAGFEMSYNLLGFAGLCWLVGCFSCSQIITGHQNPCHFYLLIHSVIEMCRPQHLPRDNALCVTTLLVLLPTKGVPL